MEQISRRNMLLVGGAAGASLVSGTALLAPAYAGSPKRIRATLDRSAYRRGDRMRLRITEELKPGRRIRVTDNTGLRWKRVSRSGKRQVWTARAASPGSGRVTVVATRANGREFRDRVFRDRVGYRIIGGGPPLGAGAAMIGMSAPAGLWAQRVGEVGSGLGARRIFADLTSNGQDQSNLIRDAHNAGMMPVVSYKVPSFASAATGSYDAWATNAANYLASFDKPTAVCIWHEPMSDMTGAQFVAMQNRLMPKFKGVGQLKVGPILNGFLLTQPNQGSGQGVNEFTTYTTPALLNLWDYFGIDTYQPGSMSAPGPLMPAARVTKLLDWLDDHGKTGMPIGVGEYNGFSAAAITGMGEALLDPDSHTYFGCVWNVDQARAGILTGDRLASFRQTLADPRCAEPR